MTKGELKIGHDGKWIRVLMYSEDAVERLQRLASIAQRYQDTKKQCDEELDQCLGEARAENTTTEVNGSVESISRRALGQRSIDYLVRVAAQSTPQTHVADLIVPMKALGWQTTSETQRTIVNNLLSACRRNPKFLTLTGERVTLTEEGRTFAQLLPPLDTPDAPQ